MRLLPRLDGDAMEIIVTDRSSGSPMKLTLPCIWISIVTSNCDALYHL